VGLHKSYDQSRIESIRANSIEIEGGPDSVKLLRNLNRKENPQLRDQE